MNFWVYFTAFDVLQDTGWWFYYSQDIQETSLRKTVQRSYSLMDSDTPTWTVKIDGGSWTRTPLEDILSLIDIFVKIAAWQVSNTPQVHYIWKVIMMWPSCDQLEICFSVLRLCSLKGGNMWYLINNVVIVSDSKHEVIWSVHVEQASIHENEWALVANKHGTTEGSPVCHV